MKKKYLLLIKLFLSILILFTLFYKIGIYNIYSTFLTIKFIYFPYIIILISLAFIIIALNFKILLYPLYIKIPFFRLLKYCTIAWSIGLFVPGKIGEFSIIYFLKKENIELGKSTAITLIDKLITIFIMGLFALLGFFIFFTKLEFLKLLTILIVGFLIPLFSISSYGRNIIKKYILKKYAIKFEGFSYIFFQFFKKRKRFLILNFINTLIKLIVTSTTMYFLFKSFNITISIFYIMVIYATLNIIAFIPITISGLGIKESAAVFFYSLINVTPSITLNVHIILLLIHYFIAFLTIIFLLSYSQTQDLLGNSFN